MDNSEIVNSLMSVFDLSDDLRRENLALRTVLRRQGLSGAVIQRRVNVYKKARKGEDSALLRYQQCFEEILKRLPVIDLQERLAALPLKGKIQ